MHVADTFGSHDRSEFLSRIRHRNALTEKAWEHAVQGLGKALSMERKWRRGGRTFVTSSDPVNRPTSRFIQFSDNLFGSLNWTFPRNAWSLSFQYQWISVNFFCCPIVTLN